MIFLRLLWPDAMVTEERGTFKRFARNSTQAWLARPSDAGAVRQRECVADVEAERASATYEDGILRIEIPLVQQQEDQAKRIPIESRAEEEDA